MSAKSKDREALVVMKRYRGWVSVTNTLCMRVHEVRGARKEYRCFKCKRAIGVGEPYVEYKPAWSYARPDKWCWNCAYGRTLVPENPKLLERLPE